MIAKRLSLQSNPIKEMRRTRGVGGVAMGIKSEFGASQGAPGALFGQSKAFHCRTSGVWLGFRCLSDQRNEFAGCSLDKPTFVF